jgi:hypothetical protein
MQVRIFSRRYCSSRRPYPHHLLTILVGGGCGKLQGGRHIAAKVETPLMNLGLSLIPVSVF